PTEAAAGHARQTTTPPSASTAGAKRSTQRTRARSAGTQSAPTPLRLRYAARTRLFASTTSVTSWPRDASRSVYARIARTPPAIRMWGTRKVILTERSDRHRDRAGLLVRLRVGDDVDTPDL